MAKVKAKVSFAGVVTMGAGEVRNITDKEVLTDLIKAGYVEEVKSSTPSKATEKKTNKKGDE